MKIDQCYLVNLARRKDRRDSFTEMCKRLDDGGQYPFQGFKVMPAIDGQLCTPPSWFKQGKGAWGCYQSHLRVLEDALHNKYDCILIAEDDVVFPDDLKDRFDAVARDVPDDWEQLYLGGHNLFPHRHSPVVIPGKCVARAFNVNGTFCYMLRGSGIAKAYAWLNKVDEWMKWPRHHVDHRYGMAHESKQWVAYVASPFIIGHNAGTSDVGKGRESVEYFSGPASNPSTVLHDQPPIFVLGAFRGGSSITARILECLGVQMLPDQRRHSVGNDYETVEDQFLRHWITRCWREPGCSRPLSPATRSLLV